ncbi:BcepNY3gp48 [Burkholderia phage BcepNY3]|uniref:Gp49 n=2 Tax=Naesvirus TaxID=2733115 RepID=Q6UIY2_9CAUD|nr:gp49 [Burkholderia phage Bcep1]YP_001294886.1 BcepNY3gp48 [Burkholderia phage BcepNY3]AAQ73396.1 gp49 [Burkholderia phage Bcep1]ABR10583.1 BcepNY3gp48 [Burkholderia phage BcepNY3]
MKDEYVDVDGKRYCRTTFYRDSGHHVVMFTAFTAKGVWRVLPPRCAKIRARIDSALDNPQTSD